jgi:hypothetical protein
MAEVKEVKMEVGGEEGKNPPGPARRSRRSKGGLDKGSNYLNPDALATLLSGRSTVIPGVSDLERALGLERRIRLGEGEELAVPDIIAALGGLGGTTLDQKQITALSPEYIGAEDQYAKGRPGNVGAGPRFGSMRAISESFIRNFSNPERAAFLQSFFENLTPAQQRAYQFQQPDGVIIFPPADAKGKQMRSPVLAEVLGKMIDSGLRTPVSRLLNGAIAIENIPSAEVKLFQDLVEQTNMVSRVPSQQMSVTNEDRSRRLSSAVEIDPARAREAILRLTTLDPKDIAKMRTGFRMSGTARSAELGSFMLNNQSENAVKRNLHHQADALNAADRIYAAAALRQLDEAKALCGKNPAQCAGYVDRIDKQAENQAKEQWLKYRASLGRSEEKARKEAARQVAASRIGSQYDLGLLPAFFAEGALNGIARKDKVGYRQALYDALSKSLTDPATYSNPTSVLSATVTDLEPGRIGDIKELQQPVPIGSFRRVKKLTYPIDRRDRKTLEGLSKQQKSAVSSRFSRFITSGPTPIRIDEAAVKAEAASRRAGQIQNALTQLGLRA